MAEIVYHSITVVKTEDLVCVDLVSMAVIIKLHSSSSRLQQGNAPVFSALVWKCKQRAYDSQNQFLLCHNIFLANSMPLLFDATGCSFPTLLLFIYNSVKLSFCGSNKTRSQTHASVCLQAQLIAQSIGQAFSVAYQEFLRANGINPEDLSQKEYSDIINTQEMYNDDLIHFSNSENCKEVGVYQMCRTRINFLQLQDFPADVCWCRKKTRRYEI